MLESNCEVIKIKVGQFKYPVTLIDLGNKYELRFNYNKGVVDEVKAFEGSKWHGFDGINPRKVWTIPKTPHNEFQLDYLRGKNPYQRYDQELISFTPRRKETFVHQIEGTAFLLTRRQCILAYEPGVGKTLIAIEALEYLVDNKELEFDDIIWIAPRSALISVQIEFHKWKTFLQPKLYTYEGFKSLIANKQTHTPKAIIFDECQKIKNPSAQRSQAAKFAADSVRERYGSSGLITEMSGSPAPKDPSDWFHLCEVACPGFLREGSKEKLKNRLAWIV